MENIKQRKITPAFVNTMFIFMAMFYVGGSFVLGVIFSHIRETNEDFKLPIYMSLILSQLLIWVGMLIYMAIRRRNPFLKSDFILKMKVSKVLLNILLIVIFTFSVLPIVWFLNALTMMFVENAVAETSQAFLSYPLVVQLLVMAVMPGISEELLCRGAIFGGLKRHNILKAIIASGLFFGILHMNINQFAYATALGILFALLNEATGKIYSSMLSHYTVNSFSVVLSYIMEKVMKNLPQMQEQMNATQNNGAQTDGTSMVIVLIAFGIMAVAGAVIGFLLLWAIAAINGRVEHMKSIFKKGSVNPYAYEDEEESKSVFNWAFWLAVVLGFTYMIVTEFVIK